MKKVVFVISVTVLYALVPLLFVSLLDNALSIKYEVFEPSESYYFKTIVSDFERSVYVDRVNSHSEKLYRKQVVLILTLLLSLILPTLGIVFRKRIVKR